jgi:hypothetical protein
MSHFVWEIVLTVISVVLAAAMLFASVRFYSVTSMALRYVLALLAWVPVWVFTYLLWHPLTGHHSDFYPWWFWLLLGLAIVATVASLAQGISLLWLVRLLVLAMVVTQLWNVGWFSYQDTQLEQITKAVQAQLEEARADATKEAQGKLDAAVSTQSRVDAEQNRRLDALEKDVANLKDHDKVQDKAIADIKNQFSHLQTGSTTTVTSSDTTDAVVAKAVAKYLYSHGWSPSDVRIGTVNWDDDPYEADQRYSFYERLESRQEIRKFWQTNNARAKAALNQAVNAVPVSEKPRVVSGACYVPIQYMKPIEYAGNGAFMDGVIKRGGTTTRAAGDVVWACVGLDGTIYWDASIRADCGNPSFSKPPTPQHETPSVRHTPSGTSTSSRTPHTPSTTPSTHRTTTTSSTPSHSTSSTTSSCKRPPSPGKGYVESGECGWVKNQTQWCMDNAQDPSCPQPSAGQQPQSNHGQPTGGTSGAPSTPSTQSPTSSAPTGGRTGPDGQTTGGTQPDNSPSPGVTGDNTGAPGEPSGG